MNESQLRWVQKNRQVAERLVRVGELASEFLQVGSVVDAACLARVRELLVCCTDEDFRRHCSLGPVRSGVLTVLVDSESRVQEMRLRWLMPLREMLAARLRDFCVSGIRFVQGEGGLCLQRSATGDQPADPDDRPAAPCRGVPVPGCWGSANEHE